MLGIVLANNFLQMFIFWELVGVSSYLLIGFWFERPAAADAGKKAFITNRLGDFGFLLGILTGLGELRLAQLRVSSRRRISANPQALGRAGHCRRPADLLRRDGQVRAIPAARLAARRHGRPDAGQRADPRRDDGGRGRLHALPGVLPASTSRRADACIALDRRLHRVAVRASSPFSRTTSSASSPTRRSRNSATWSWRSACSGPTPGDVPPDHARLLQGAAVPGRRLGHPRAASRAGHLEDGRAAHEDAGDLLDLHGRHAGAVRACRRSAASSARTASSRRLRSTASRCSFWALSWRR